MLFIFFSFSSALHERQGRFLAAALALRLVADGVSIGSESELRGRLPLLAPGAFELAPGQTNVHRVLDVVLGSEIAHPDFLLGGVTMAFFNGHPLRSLE
jgi:hypothetical protein